MVELADTLDLGSDADRCEGSSPSKGIALWCSGSTLKKCFEMKNTDSYP